MLLPFRRTILVLIALGVAGSALATRADAQAAKRKPNIIFILTDDLGYGDLGCYGQKKIQTPNLDRMAAQGMRFTQAYAGSTVCAPSRCTLMTGKHTGHATVRGNAKVNTPLAPADTCVATLLKAAGYVTAMIGKWGLGEAGSIGAPNKQGFDYFFGFLNHHHAHNHYPDFLWRNEKKVELPGNVVANNVATRRAVYSQDLFLAESLKFLEENRSRPFFLYLAFTIPHANNEAGKQGMETPSDEPYSKEAWPQPQKNHAAMITRMDRDVGKIFDKIRELGIDDDTIVFFSSDNGPHQEGGADPFFFRSMGPLRGFKRSMHDGGIRVPMIVRAPGRIKAGAVDDQVWAFWDFLPTACDLAGAKTPKGLNGLSVAPTLLGQPGQKQHDYLYWEFHERGFHQAIRQGDWKGIRSLAKSLELYDLKNDIGESRDLAIQHPDVVRRLNALLDAARVDSPEFPVRPFVEKKKANKQKAGES